MPLISGVTFEVALQSGLRGTSKAYQNADNY